MRRGILFRKVKDQDGDIEQLVIPRGYKDELRIIGFLRMLYFTMLKYPGSVYVCLCYCENAFLCLFIGIHFRPFNYEFMHFHCVNILLLSDAVPNRRFFPNM